jgi:hypothetical protein
MTVYDTKDYWIFRLFPSSGILGTRKHDVSETGSVWSSGVGGNTPCQLGLLDRANLNHWTSDLFPKRRVF